MLAKALRPELVLLYLYFASALYIHFRGRVRHSFARQLSDHSTFMAPVNCFMYAFSAVPNTPVLDTAMLPELAAVRENWRTIRDEALALYSEGAIKASEQYDDLAFNSFFKKGWKRFYLKWYGDYLPSAREACPKTVALLESIPTMNAAMFAVLPPGAQLVTHRDPYAGSLRYHLGLVTPNDKRCRIYIDGNPYVWRDGEDIVFDETYIHSARNDSDKLRIILFADVERPMRYRFARAFNRWFSRQLVRFTATKNVEGETVGVLNRLFGYIYPVRLRIKAFKRGNRKLYYALKYVFFGGLVSLLVWSAVG